GLMPHELLSEREQEVLMGLVRGQSGSDIALLLEVSPNTVSTYRTRILMKMDMKNNADLITYAISNGIV
ncbi:MAG TPA: LuxR C-terminal-related transcriptional regulator, partial [Chitinophagaceae bacterium]|nr:LuxR C-terminal-related transcriptional regulator [Chitinophagaceae bacterium]